MASRGYIVGIAELYGQRMERELIDLHLEASSAALIDAGLSPGAIDGVLTNSPSYAGGVSFSTVLAEALGIKSLKLSHVIEVGGASPCAMIGLAAQAVSNGICNAVLVSTASTRFSRLLGSRSISQRQASSLDDCFEAPTLATTPGMYALAATRHMHLYNSTSSQFAHIAVEARANAARTAHAVMTRKITVDDVLESKMIASPLRLLDCCIFTDYAGAVVVTSAQLARDAKGKAVGVLGAGEGHTHAHLTSSPNLLSTGAKISGAAAFAQADVSVKDINFVQLYDCFTIAVVLELEDLGFCERGEGGAFAASGALKFDGDLPFNTNGGLLSFHSGGIYHVTEGVRQIRGDAGERQLNKVQLGLIHGNGGVYAHHATLILAEPEFRQ